MVVCGAVEVVENVEVIAAEMTDGWQHPSAPSLATSAALA